MKVELEDIIQKLAGILSANIDQRLTVALATGIVNLLNQEFNKPKEEAPDE